MSYDGKIMRQALARFEEDKQRRAAEFARRRDRLYETEPRLKEIEQQLRATMPKLIASALRRGAAPQPAVLVVQDENLDMQRRMAAELEEALTMICRFNEKSETEIVDCLENGKPQTMDTPLTFTSTGSDEKWASLITF